MQESATTAGGVSLAALPLMSGETQHPILGRVKYEAREVGDDPYEQVKRTIQLMCGYALSDSTSPEIQAEAGEVKWQAGMGASPLDLVCGVWKKTQGKIQFLRDEVSGAPLESFLSQTYEGEGKPVIEILIRPRDMAVLTPGVSVGDCDDYSMYAASLLTALGIPCSFVTVAADPRNPFAFTHVYVAAYPNGQRVPVDASHGKYCGWEAANAMDVGRVQEWPLDDPMKNCTDAGLWAMAGVAVVGVLAWAIGRMR